MTRARTSTAWSLAASLALAAGCGPGLAGVAEHETGDAADDGNGYDNDNCLNSCVLASCGDGVGHAWVEECDDGNDVDDDTCHNDCTWVLDPLCLEPHPELSLQDRDVELFADPDGVLLCDRLDPRARAPTGSARAGIRSAAACSSSC